MGNYSIIIKDGERKVIILQNCCPDHNCVRMGTNWELKETQGKSQVGEIMSENEKDLKIKALEEKVHELEEQFWQYCNGPMAQRLFLGKREINYSLNCCPFHNCDSCSFFNKLSGAIEQVFKEQVEWPK